MKKNQVNEILAVQTKRRNKIISYTCVITIITVIMLSFIFLHIAKNRTVYVSYTEDSSLDYKVYLKENDFFTQNYLPANNQYIASLIDKIKANFHYKLEVDEKNLDYKYSYRVEATVNVLDKDTKNSLYVFKDDLFQTKTFTQNSNTSVDIDEDILIDYNKYNDLIKRFVNVYDLENSLSTLDVKMYVKVFGECEELEDVDKDSVISLSIPLTTKTVAIDMSYNLVEPEEENLMACKTVAGTNNLFLVLSVITLFVDFLVVVSLIRYTFTSRTAESIYERELKKILNNYKSYIQKINNQFDLTGYQVMKVDTFTDMLEIRDTIQEPILMVENKEKTGAYFLIPSKTKIIYMYGLKVCDIKKKMKNRDNIYEEVL